jgi:prophage maintenance system killer protein
MSEIPEEDVWYPDEKFVLKAHDLLLKKYGGYPGFNVGIEVFKYILKEVKSTRGIYRKAAILLRKLVATQIFQNGHHRTAFEVTKIFLEMNDAEIKIQGTKKIIKFIKNILYYNIDEIEAWLRDGKVPQRADENSSEKH